ncbi:QueT transporter family protein [Streptococcus catagoni]|uniref:QueT transporter family protein n=1 Tax=Streptococcus catagoni TaxID=2654874 RepID=UPI00140BBD4B|nr:QueT transporter family protein [Streptococcus catagoni]
MKNYKIKDFVHIALVVALYVVLTITPPLNAISYGMYQFRVSEMMNFLAFYNRKYIIAVTIGCMISNFYSFGLIDVLVGGGSTLLFVSSGVILFDRYKKDYFFNGLINKAFFYFAIFFSLSMLTVAIELSFFGSPLLLTWLTTAVGEFVSLLIGSFIIDKLGKQIDLTQ